MVKNKLTKTPYDWKERRGVRAYEYGLKNNVLIRPLGNVIYFMPPYIINKNEIDKALEIGALKARKVAGNVLKRVRTKIGY